MDDTPNKPGETGTPKAPETNAPAPATPPQVNADGEAEKLRKELEQARMRANQLENEKKAREEADAKAEAERLEKSNEFKTLFEQEKAKREALEAEQAAEEQRKELSAKREEVLKDYSEEVRALAQEAGMDLSSTDEATIATFKGKLDKIATMVSANAKVTPNNPNRPNQGTQTLSPEELREALKTDEGFAAEVAKRPGLAMMTNQRGKV